MGKSSQWYSTRNYTRTSFIPDIYTWHNGCMQKRIRFYIRIIVAHCIVYLIMLCQLTPLTCLKIDHTSFSMIRISIITGKPTWLELMTVAKVIKTLISIYVNLASVSRCGHRGFWPAFTTSLIWFILDYQYCRVIRNKGCNICVTSSVVNCK